MKRLIANEVSFAYDEKYTLENISFTIQKGEGCILLAGDNGAGKSTLLNVLCGVLKIDDGEVIREGLHIAYLPFDSPLYEHLTVLDNLRYFYRCFQKKDFSLKDTFVQHILQTLSIDYLNQRMDQCSSGQRQKASIACVLLSGADMIILDEPFVAIDAKSTQGLLKLIVEMKKDTLFLITSHTIEELQVNTDRLLVLREHKLELDLHGQEEIQNYFKELKS